jgi:hypothetical protein
VISEWCSHCDAELRKSDGLCAACYQYRYKYGQLPSEELLIARTERREEERLERLAWSQAPPALLRRSLS